MLTGTGHDQSSDSNPLLESLRLASLNPRLLKVPAGHADTLSWIWTADTVPGETYKDWLKLRLDELYDRDWSSSDYEYQELKDMPSVDPGYVAWLRDPDSPIFCIRGLPGAGKSSLMQYLYSNERTARFMAKTTTKCRKVAYFFHELGAAQEKRRAGFWCSLLYQIVSGSETLQQVIAPIFHGIKRHASTGQLSWPATQINAALDLLASTEMPKEEVYVFIDGLDECEDLTYDFMHRLCRLTDHTAWKSVQFRLCIASRPHPQLDPHLDRYTGFELQLYNKVDIFLFAEDKLRTCLDLSMYTSENAVEKSALLSAEIANSARGVFLWAVLAVGEVRTSIGNGDDWEAVQVCLHQLPKELSTLYSSIFNKIDPKHLGESLLFLDLVHTWNIAWRDPLGVLDMAFAVKGLSYVLGHNFDFSIPITKGLEKKMKRRIVSRCRNLLVIRYGNWIPSDTRLTDMEAMVHYTGTYEVEVLHRTVFEYLQGSSCTVANIQQLRVSDSELFSMCLAACLYGFNAQDCDFRTSIGIIRFPDYAANGITKMYAENCSWDARSRDTLQQFYDGIRKSDRWFLCLHTADDYTLDIDSTPDFEESRLIDSCDLYCLLAGWGLSSTLSDMLDMAKVRLTNDQLLHLFCHVSYSLIWSWDEETWYRLSGTDSIIVYLHQNMMRFGRSLKEQTAWQIMLNHVRLDLIYYLWNLPERAKGLVSNLEVLAKFLRCCLELGADPDVRLGGGPLSTSASPSLLTPLQLDFCEPNCGCGRGSSFLGALMKHWGPRCDMPSAAAGLTHLIQSFIDHGANLESVNGNGATVLEIALKTSEEIVRGVATGPKRNLGNDFEPSQAPTWKADLRYARGGEKNLYEMLLRMEAKAIAAGKRRPRESKAKVDAGGSATAGDREKQPSGRGWLHRFRRQRTSKRSSTHKIVELDS